VPKAGSYLFISKVALAKATTPDGSQVNCVLAAGRGLTTIQAAKD
jgi:hypothetical protein